MSSKYTVSNTIVTSEVGDEMVILLKNGKKVILLNETSTFIFKLIDAGHNHDEIVSALMQQYNIDNTVASEGVVCTLKTFIDKGVIQLNADN